MTSEGRWPIGGEFSVKLVMPYGGHGILWSHIFVFKVVYVLYVFLFFFIITLSVPDLSFFYLLIPLP